MDDDERDKQHLLDEKQEDPEKKDDETIDASAFAAALDDYADHADQTKRHASPRRTRQSQKSLRSEQSSEDRLVSTRSKKRPLPSIGEDEEEDKHSSQG